jgi:AP-3 complex subunit delta-1
LEEPRFPKSLYLIHPLFTGYELNPLGINAQTSVVIPEGLDLDSWIVPPPREAEPHHVDDEKDGSGKKARSKKGKGKDVGSATTSKKKKGKENGDHTMLIPADSEETPEERVQREKV